MKIVDVALVVMKPSKQDDDNDEMGGEREQEFDIRINTRVPYSSSSGLAGYGKCFMLH